MNNKTINRIKSTSLTFKEDVCFYQNDRFNGVAIAVNPSNGLVTSIVLYNDGKPSGPYNGHYFDYANKVLVDADFLVEHDRSVDGEPFSFNNKPFTGIAFEFDDDFCLVEQEYVDGYTLGVAANNGSGNLYSLGLYNYHNCSQIYEWHNNGELKRISITSKQFAFSFDENDEGALQSFKLEGDYFHELEKRKDLIAFPVIDKLTIVLHVLLNDWLTLIGDQITDVFFSGLLQNPAIDNVKRIHLLHTAMTEESFTKLVVLKNLEEISFEDMNISRSALEKLKGQLPDCKIKLAREEIVLSDKK